MIYKQLEGNIQTSQSSFVYIQLNGFKYYYITLIILFSQLKGFKYSYVALTI